MAARQALNLEMLVRFQPPQPSRKAKNIKGGIFQESSVTVASLLSEAGTTITSGLGIVWNLMTANPLLTLFLGAGIVTLCFRMFKKAKGTAKG